MANKPETEDELDIPLDD